jgi:hypothetical protein
MKHLFNDLNQTEKNKILEMHKALDNRNVIEEQEQYTPGMGGAFDNKLRGQRGGGGSMSEITKGVNMDGSLFANGVDRIDKSSDAYNKGLQNLRALKNIIDKEGLNNVIVTIQGGASAVGSSQGYDNTALAKRRANNFISAIKQDLGADLPFRINVNTNVGTATVKNSPDAKAEQFVKIIYPNQTKLVLQSGGEGRDNTALSQVPSKNSGGSTSNMESVKLQIYYKKGQRQALLKHINSAGDTIKPVVIDINTGDWAK